MRLRYDGVCSRCSAKLLAGVTADYDRTTKTVACVTCGTTPADRSTAEAIAAAPGSAVGEAASAGLAVVEGVAGGSAKAEFDRRHDARRERVQARFPRAGKLLLAVFDDPPSTTAWAKGAFGEQKFARKLAEIAGPLLRVLHDRRIPGTRANIDHMVVCPTGVYVIDVKHYQGKRPTLRVEGGWHRPRQEFLMINGRDRTKLVEGMHKQVSLVRAVLADHPHVPIHGVLCFIGADWPLLSGPFRVKSVDVLHERKLRAMLSKPGPLAAESVEDIQWLLHQAFPRAHRTVGAS